jgi:hypothetical protein
MVRREEGRRPAGPGNIHNIREWIIRNAPVEGDDRIGWRLRLSRPNGYNWRYEVPVDGGTS